MAQLNFNANSVEPAQAMEPIPAGWYNAQITASEIKPTSNGLGSFVAITCEILGGDFNKRKVFDRFNIVNANPTAVEIAYKQLSALCHAVGVIDMQDTQQLHGRPFQVKVSLRAAGLGSDNKYYEAQNEVKGYKAVGAAGATAAAPAGMQAAPPAWASAAPQQQAPVAAAPAWAQQAPVAAPVQQAPVQAAPAQAWAPPAQAAATPAAAQPWQPPVAAAAPVAVAPAQPWAPAQAAAPVAQATPPWAQTAPPVAG